MPIIVDFGSGPDPDTGLLLTSVFLNAADNLADLCSFRLVGQSIPVTTASRAEARQLINRRRIIRRGTAAYDSFSLTLVSCNPTQVGWLKDHVGELMCVRDHVGNKVYAFYADLPRDIATYTRAKADVKLTLEEITHTEAV